MSSKDFIIKHSRKINLLKVFSISDTGTTQAPAVPVQEIYTFNLEYTATVDCDIPDTKSQIKANLLIKIQKRLRTLAKEFVNLCRLQEKSNCFASLTLDIKCKKITTRKRAIEPTTIDVQVKIPDLGYV